MNRSAQLNFRVVSLVVALVCFAPTLLAHDSPEHVVEDLTTQMKRTGKTAELLLRRAVEYRVLGQLERAALDLSEALTLERDQVAALAELSRVRLAQNNFKESLEAINGALAAAPAPAERAPLYMVRARIHAAQGNDTAALADCESAFNEGGAELDWYLIRSQAQARLGQTEKRLAGLKQGFDKTGSVVLQVEWIEALIDAGKHRQALRHIERELADSRWQSAWRLRRARARSALGERDAARKDLLAAIAELDQRINPKRPDATLLVDRGLAYALLGQLEEARADHEAAKTLRADDSMLRRLNDLLKKSDAKF